MADQTETAEQRLRRLETRVVKYQEANVQQLMGINEALNRLCDSIDSLIQQEKDNERK